MWPLAARNNKRRLFVCLMLVMYSKGIGISQTSLSGYRLISLNVYHLPGPV